MKIENLPIDYCTYTDDYKKALVDEINSLEPLTLSENNLLMLCLAAIVDEQQRQADNIPGDTSIRHKAIYSILNMRYGG